MFNSFVIFLAFIAFLAFGYLSLLRILYRQFFRTAFRELGAGLGNYHSLKHIGSSALFVSLPATSLLLFWGWGPALLWLLSFHFLADSLVNLQITAAGHQRTLSDYLAGSDKPAISRLMRGLLQLYLILLLSVVLTLLAQVIDKESGLLFAFIGLIPAYRLLHSDHSAVPNLLKQFGALLLLISGFMFANKLGFAIYGDWFLLGDHPLGDYAPWLRVNNSTVLAGVLLIAGFMLADNKAFSDDVARLSGAIIIATILVLMARLAWLQPILDAPVNSTQISSDELPLFLSFCLFLFAGLTTLFFRIFNIMAATNTALSPAADFGRVQTESLLQLLLALLLVLCLAAAFGIGAWKTHYLDWVKADFIGHLNLAINSLLSLIHSAALSAHFIRTLIVAGFCMAGLNFLSMCIKALPPTQQDRAPRVSETESLIALLARSRLLQAGAAFMLSSYFIANSISLNVWLLIGIISWVIVMQFITAMTVSMKHASFARLIYGSQCLILIGLGFVQTAWISTRWLLAGQLPFAICGFCLLIIAAYLWWLPLRKIISGFGKTKAESLLEFDS